MQLLHLLLSFIIKRIQGCKEDVVEIESLNPYGYSKADRRNRTLIIDTAVGCACDKMLFGTQGQPQGLENGH